jgi:hypothetical protein
MPGMATLAGSASLLRIQAPASRHPRRHGRAPSRTNSSPNRSRSRMRHHIIVIAEVPAAETSDHAVPCHRCVLAREAPQWGIGSPGGPELSACCLLRKPISRRARDLAGPAKTKPRPAHAGADQGCAGRRGDGGWGEPARQRLNVRSRRGFRASVRFLFRGRLRREGSARAAQPAAPRSTAWVVRSGAKSSMLSMARICASRARARCTRLLIVPTRHPQISAASS